MKIKVSFLSFMFTLLCVMQTVAAEIPAKFIGKWVTISTDVAAGGQWYLYAYEADGQCYLGQTKSAPTESNYASYCWYIEGDQTEGYTFRCLKYERQDGTDAEKAAARRYITNPTTIASNTEKVLLTNNASRYLYTENRQLQLKENTNFYIAMFSRNYNEFRLYTSPNYEGSRLNFSAIKDWTVEAKVVNPDGSTAELSNGGVVVGGTNYTNGQTFTGGFNPAYTQLVVNGYTGLGFDVDEEANIITSKYVNNTQGVTIEQAPAPTAGGNAITGTANKIWLLDPQHYITNNTGGTPKYTTVPEGKAWEMDIEVERSGDEIAFNQWGSTIIASTADPFNAQYYNNFQLYQLKAGRINFKSSVASGADHYIAQSNSIKQNYKIIVRCNGENVYVIRTILLDNDFEETSTSYDNLYVSARNQGAISQMSCALPEGINIKSLKITIAEESGLIEGQSYTIYNTGCKKYLSWDYTSGSEKFRKMDGYLGVSHASECQIEFADGNKVTCEGGLHTPFYLKTDVWDTTNQVVKTLYVGENNEVVDDAENKKKFIFANKRIVPVVESGQSSTAGTPWTMDGSDQWTFDMFATYDVSVTTTATSGFDVSTKGGMYYKQTQYRDGSQVKYPASASSSSFPYWKEDGYVASVTKDGTQLVVNYISDNDYFTNLPVALNENTQGTTPDHKFYGSVYAPVALTMPAGVKAYKVTGSTTEGGETVMTLEKIADGDDNANNILHSASAAILIKDNVPDATTVFTVAAAEPATVSGNILQGSIGLTERDTQVTTYVLSGKSGIGFYQYTGDVIPAYKAYYTDAVGQAKRFVFSITDNVPTSIQNVKNNVRVDGRYYDLMGRAVTTPARGSLYIRNGKKIVY